MDAKQSALEQKLAEIVKQAAEVRARIQAIEQGPGTPHYDQIESHAHGVSQQLSQMMQQPRTADVTSEYPLKIDCPDSGKSSQVTTESRQLISQDGPVKLTENVARCSHCRRDFSPQREALGLDPRKSTSGFKRQMVILNAETRSLKRAAIVMQHVVGLSVSTNTIERVATEVGNDLEAAELNGWQDVLNGEVPVPSVAIVEFDGGRIRTRKTGCGPGVHLDNKGWNESKNAIFVSATSETFSVDPQPQPPKCFLDRGHVAEPTERTKTKKKQGEDDRTCDEVRDPKDKEKRRPTRNTNPSGSFGRSSRA